MPVSRPSRYQRSDNEMSEILRTEASKKGWYIQTGNNINPNPIWARGHYAVALTDDDHKALADAENQLFRVHHEQDTRSRREAEEYEYSDELSFETLRRIPTFVEGYTSEPRALIAAMLSLKRCLTANE